MVSTEPRSLGAPTTRGGLQGTGLPLGHCRHRQPWLNPGTQAGRADSTPELALAAIEPCIISGIMAETRAACTDLSKMMYTPETRATSQPLLSLSDLVLRAVGFKGVAQFWTVNSALLVKGEPKCLH